MPRDIAVSIGLALVKVGGALGSDTLDSDPSQQQSPTTYGTVTDQNALSADSASDDPAQ